jgi:membrane associated rhomboid family serine protease
LAAAGFDYRPVWTDGQWVIRVRPGAAQAAWDEITAYEEVNRGWPPVPADSGAGDAHGVATYAALRACGVIVVLYLWFGPYHEGLVLLRHAAADAARMVEGEWWRAVTALTLHSGVVHLLGNVAALFGFGHFVCRTYGGGVGLSLILAGGVCGNLAVAYVFPSPGVSIGASTACFSALGILAAHRMVAGPGHGAGGMAGRRRWLPLGAGLALLAYFGAGPRTDLAAHALGFVAGTVLAVPCSVLLPDRVPRRVQVGLELVCGGVIWLAWRLAARAAGA